MASSDIDTFCWQCKHLKAIVGYPHFWICDAEVETWHGMPSYIRMSPMYEACRKVSKRRNDSTDK